MSFELLSMLGLVLPLVVGGAIVVFVLTTVRKRAGGQALRSAFGMGPSADDQAKAAHLQATGRKARAHLTGVRPTGVVVNHMNVGVDMSFLLEPLDGSPRFEGTKRAVVSQAQMPRVGDVWPGWYDGADRSVFMVAMATQATPETIGLYREFGIPHPLDQMMGGAATSGSAPSPSPQPDRVGELERLAKLHEAGHLTALEFAEAKRRLLGA